MTQISDRLTLEIKSKIESCIFENFPFEDGNGGAIYASSIESCLLSQLTFYNCTANHGGAVAIESSLVFLYTSCFSLCSAREKVENGGNAFYTTDCSFVIDLISSYKCAPDSTTCGDAVFQVRTTEVLASHANFSSCNGKQGECSFGSIDTEESHVCYLNVVDCYENSMYLLPGSTLEFANFLKNDPYQYFVDGTRGKIIVKKSYFFGNTVRDDGSATTKNNIQYKDCHGDIIRNGVSYITETQTHYPMKIMPNNCKYELCSEHGAKTRKSALFFSLHCFAYLRYGNK